VADFERRVTEDLDEQHRRREKYLADRELGGLLEVTNAPLRPPSPGAEHGGSTAGPRGGSRTAEL
jgi:hypothetical protein